MTYAEYVAALANTIVINASDVNFTQILPTCITYAEQRIYRELDLLQTIDTDVDNLVANQRTVDISGFIVVQSMNVITPAATNPDSGTRNALQRVSIEYLNYTWPSVSDTGVPEIYANLDNETIVLAPTPDAAYRIETVGTVRPAPLSASNTETILTTYLPDLFFAASMVFMMGWQRNFGAQTDDPAAAVSWEMQYKQLMASAMLETSRIKSAAAAWQSYSPSAGTPPRQ